ncbi:MAG: acetoacetate--CoA ligase [Acidimicrobiales bacterium]|nr:acetoacetate--CoA ligase [Acidimicrobiales bacterium]
MAAGDLLWEPTEASKAASNLGQYVAWLAEQGIGRFDTYDELWRWSVTDLDAFWASIWDYFRIEAATPYQQVLAQRAMPGARWFDGATPNDAGHFLRVANDPANRARVALVGRSQTRPRTELTYGELAEQVARCRAGLQALGVVAGDRVAAYLPHIPETIVAFLAATSMGAIWSTCAPEFGTRSVVDRLGQIEPKVLLVVDGYRFGDKAMDRTAEVAAIRQALPSLEHTVVLPYLEPDPGRVPGAMTWEQLLAVGPAADAPGYDPVPFTHPLYVLYSSGTTGLPKAIVHGHGGVTLEHHKLLGFFNDCKPTDRFFWFSTTGWMMWNYVLSSLLFGSTLICLDGNPLHPDNLALWTMAAEEGVTFFGGSAPYYVSCRKQGLRLDDAGDLSAVRNVGSTGAPLPPEAFDYLYEQLGSDLFLNSVSGGTDIASAFVGMNTLSPVWSGEMSTPYLGCKLEAFGPDGVAVPAGETGELVVTEPMPSMPVGFWNDPDGAKYRAAYFEDFPGVWRHGDWLTFTDHGSCVISGRSDATLNRGGVRLGTSEFYSVVAGLPEVTDSLVVHLEDRGGTAGELLLFVVLQPGNELDDALRGRIAGALRSELSPRHVPDRMVAVASVPRTLSGKKLELPVKRILQGADPDKVASRGSLANPESLTAFEALAGS